jgi:uncharacterized membrane protein
MAFGRLFVAHDSYSGKSQAERRQSTHVKFTVMTKARLEAFSDGVMAILITIMVLELKVPHGDNWDAIAPLVPSLLTYLLSFIYLGIYWTNHHHLFHATDRINGSILWANLHLLFWLSLVPFATGWMGENHFASVPTAVYGAVLMLAGTAYLILERTIIRSQGAGSKLAAAVGKDVKAKASALMYALAIPIAFVHRGFAEAIYIVVALLWLIPDPRIESALRR